MTFRTKQDQVADILRERVIAGVYARGTKLKQSEIAEELGVSITPVREALHILEAEGYISGLSHRGLLVPQFDPAETQEIFDLRLMLERDLTAFALPNVTPQHLEEMKGFQRVVSELTRGRDRLATRTANFRFHFRLYELADRPQTLKFVRVLWAKYPFIYQELGGRRMRHIDEHERFLARVEAGDREGAIEAMVDHIRSGWTELHAHGWLDGGAGNGADRKAAAGGD
ncbi:GntR family transcriptional regulator [Stella sp.]|uniref:GntR family transcriptional regulator n=1 Tax=Stella sp. TaxID=2912054 RepID=UPI0035AF3E60